MGRPASGGKCCSGRCNKPLAFGVMPSQNSAYTRDSTGYAEFRADWCTVPLTWSYELATAAELLDSDFLSLRNGRIDAVVVGDVPGATEADRRVVSSSSSRMDKVWFPAASSAEETAILDYLAAGGNVIVKNTFPRDFNVSGGAEFTYSSDKQDELNAFLTTLGSNTSVVMDEDSSWPYEYDSYLSLLTSSACWTINPYNPLGKGQYRPRTLSLWKNRLVSDIINQTGHTLADAAFTATVSDETANSSTLLTNDLHSDYNQDYTYLHQVPRGRSTNHLVNETQDDWLMIRPVISASIASGTYSAPDYLNISTSASGRSIFVDNATGYPVYNGDRQVEIVVTAEALSGGGRLIVVSSKGSTYGSKSGFEYVVELLTRLLSSCDSLGNESFTYMGI